MNEYETIQSESAFSRRPAHREYTGTYDVIDLKWNIKFTGTKAECLEWIAKNQ